MQDIRSVKVSDRLPLLTTKEDGFNLYNIPFSLNHSDTNFNFCYQVASEILLSCSCPFEECDKFKKFALSSSSSSKRSFIYQLHYLVENKLFLEHGINSIHTIRFDSVFKGKKSSVYTIQAEDFSSITFIYNSGFFNSSLVEVFLKCTPSFAESLRIVDTLNSDLVVDFGDGVSGSYRSVLNSNFSNLKLFLATNENFAKKIVKNIEISDSVLSDDYSWDPNLFADFSSTNDVPEFFTVSDLFNWSAFFFVIFCIALFWEFFHTIYKKLVHLCFGDK